MGLRDDTFELHNGDTYITYTKDVLYKVTDGEIYVFIVPIQEDDLPGRRVFFQELKAGESIPGLFAYGEEGEKWAFLFSAKDYASIEYGILDDPDAYREDYAIHHGYYRADILGFEESLIETYLTKLVTENGFIYRTKRENRRIYRNTLNNVYKTLTGKSAGIHGIKRSNNDLYNAAAMVCSIKKLEIVSYDTLEKTTERNITVDNIARLSHFISRKIRLGNGWESRDMGILLGFYAGIPAVLVYEKNCYHAMLPDGGKSIRISGNNIDKVDDSAYMFYNPLPPKKLAIKDIIKFSLLNINKSDIAVIVALTVISTLIGLLIPTLNQNIYDRYIPIGESGQLVQMGTVILSCSLGNICFGILKGIGIFRLSSAMKYNTQAAIFDRLFNMPESDIKKYESVDLAQRALVVENIVSEVANVVMGTALSTIFSFLYIFRMFSYSSKLSWVAIVMVVIYGVISFLLGRRMIKIDEKLESIKATAKSKIYQYISAIEKIKISGTYNTAIHEYMEDYSKVVGLSRDQRRIKGTIDTLELIATSIFSLVLYYIMVRKSISISLGAFLGFNSAFGVFSGAITSFSSSALSILNLMPEIERLQPILDNEPEIGEGKIYPSSVEGEIEINHLTFGYEKNVDVLKDLSLHIKPGEYVAFVGSSGSGKSTLLKCLLGFEKPNSGKIYYDGRDLDKLEKRELRKKCGVVLQDGELIQGSIYENITIATSNAKKEDVDRVIEEVGLKEDISNMPMGIHTMISEGASIISGGQKQRLLIARAIINKPHIIFFDEATSALDNVLQKQISESIDALNATRIIIAHRLSTIINCDRIFLLNNGVIEEEGTYEDLMERKGMFYQMAVRQIV